MKECEQNFDYINMEFEYVDNIPVAFCRPDKEKSNNSIAVWLPYLGGNKETGAKELQRLAAHGYFSVSIDPWLHNERKDEIRNLVFSDFKAYMWQILGITAMNAYRVVDWAADTFKLHDEVVAGGLSMGGDIAIVLAGIDTRISRVGAVAASPDWNRPGMTDVMDSKKIIEQGNPTNFGKWLYNELNPMTNLASFHRPLQMHIELGKSDTHINPQWTIAFKQELCRDYPAVERNLEVVINEGYDHLSLLQSKGIIDRTIRFMTGEKQK